jgi:phosphatidylinositol-3-phosphatase
MQRSLLLFLTLGLFATVSFAQMPRSNHVYILAEENRSYEDLIGSPDMPYLNSLVTQYGLATQFYANQHSSLPDYFWVTAGQPVTMDDDTNQTFDVDSILRRVMRAGLTYKSYAQGIPYTGFSGMYYNAYMKRHAILPWYSDMGGPNPVDVNAKPSGEMLKHVDMSQWAQDVASGALPNFAFITPDALHDMHDCPNTLSECIQMADQFLKETIAPLLQRPEFQPGGDGLLILWADEADLDGIDDRCSATVKTGCGGRIVVAMIGPNVKQGFKSTQTYHHENVLRTMMEALGLPGPYPGAANTAADMAEFFNPSSNPGGITVSSPKDGSTVNSPMHVVASAITNSASTPIEAMHVYIDDQLAYRVSSGSVDTNIAVASGGHSVVVQAWQTNGVLYKTSLTVKAGTAAGITISSPAAGATLSGSMHLVANATPSSAGTPIDAMHVYVDNQLVYRVIGGNIDTNIPLSSGSHNVVVQAWQMNGTLYKKSLTVNSTAPANGITIVSPTNGANVGSSMHLIASATSGNPIDAMHLYVDDQLVYVVHSGSVDTTVPLSPGSHFVVIQAWDSAGTLFKTPLTVTAN